MQLSVYNVLLVRRAARYIYFLNFLRGAVARLHALAASKEVLDLSPAAGVHRVGYDGALVATVDALEQIVWSVFFFLDTVILGARIGAIAFPEDALLRMMEGIYFPLWFTGDATVFTKTVIRLYRNACRRAALVAEAGAAAALGVAVDGAAAMALPRPLPAPILTPPFATPVSSPIRAETASSPFQRRLQDNSGALPDTEIDVEPSNGHSFSPSHSHSHSRSHSTAAVSPSRSPVAHRSPLGHAHAHALSAGGAPETALAAPPRTVADQVQQEANGKFSVEMANSTVCVNLALSCPAPCHCLVFVDVCLGRGTAAAAVVAVQVVVRHVRLQQVRGRAWKLEVPPRCDV